MRTAVLDGGLEHGFAQVRVEEIADRAGVSPRTFFNYSDTKEDAALLDVGLRPPRTGVHRLTAGPPLAPPPTNGVPPVYARLRAEAPVHPVPLPRHGTAYLVTRYDDVAAALRDGRLPKNRRTALTPDQLARGPRFPRAFAPPERSLLSVDGGDHDRLRALVHTVSTPRRIEAMRGQAQHLADHLLDVALDRAGRDGQLDLGGASRSCAWRCRTSGCGGAAG